MRKPVGSKPSKSKKTTGAKVSRALRKPPRVLGGAKRRKATGSVQASGTGPGFSHFLGMGGGIA